MAYSPPNSRGLYTPAYEIWLNGQQIPTDYYWLIEEINFESHDSGSDLVTIYMKDPELKLIDDPRLMQGMRIRVLGGWVNDLSLWLDGYISMIDIDFPETGDTTLILTCMDESFLLDRVPKKRSFSGTTFSAVASSIAYEYGLVPQGPATSKAHDTLTQSEESDMKFLIRTADEEDVYVKITGGKLVWDYRTTEEGEVQDTFAYKTDPYSLKSFRPRVAIADKKEGADASDIDTDSGEAADGTASTPTDNPDDPGTSFWDYDPKKGIWTQIKEKLQGR